MSLSMKLIINRLKREIIQYIGTTMTTTLTILVNDDFGKITMAKDESKENWTKNKFQVGLVAKSLL